MDQGVYIMKRVLITLFYADGLHGGVKYAAELGDWFASQGYDVTCVGVKTNQATVEHFAKHKTKLVNILDFNFDTEFDLVWTHTFPIYPYLVRHGLKYKRVINSCISKILSIERFVFCTDNMDLFLTLTPEARDMYINDYSIPADKIHILPNTAPDNFFETQKKLPNTIQRIAVVSNHPPKELLDLKNIFPARNIDIVYYGGKNPIDITPKVLKNFDVVITIGKTVQYCLAMGIPVYNYDHFGGSGYITLDNIDIESAFTFSGRSFGIKKTTEQIATELESQYTSVARQATKLKEVAETKFKLSVNVRNILKILDSKPVAAHLVETNSNRLLVDYCDFIISQCAQHSNIVTRPISKAGFARLWKHLRKMKF